MNLLLKTIDKSLLWFETMLWPIGLRSNASGFASGYKILQANVLSCRTNRRIGVEFIDNFLTGYR